MEEKVDNTIENIMERMTCPKGFACLQLESKDICKVEDLGLDDYVECIEHEPRLCRFSLPFGATYFCKCKMRVHLCKKLGK
ncbi:MAG: hypothetical protein JSW47_01725 [Phycisphaerales bacterium]|nr:MAG: hypothetical protein JSW47_01725 [Phycisphaerales bacterium]